MTTPNPQAVEAGMRAYEQAVNDNGVNSLTAAVKAALAAAVQYAEDAAAARIAELEAEIKELQEPHFWWDYFGEQSAETPRDIHDGSDYGDVSEVTGGRQVCRKWAAWKCLTVDDNGDPYETDMVLFDTLDEAFQCWPDSLAAARALLAKHTEKTDE